VSALPELTSQSMTDTELADLMVNLRQYTLGNFDNLKSSCAGRSNTFPLAREFVRKGLRQSLPLRRFENVNCEWAARMLAIASGVALRKTHPFEALSVNAVANSIKFLVPTKWLKSGDTHLQRVVRRLRYPVSNSRLLLEHKAAIEAALSS
jgi:hypothetical protein